MRELQRFRPYGALAPFTLAAIPAAKVAHTGLRNRVYSMRELQRFRPYGALASFTLAAIPAAKVAPLWGSGGTSNGHSILVQLIGIKSHAAVMTLLSNTIRAFATSAP